MLKCVCVTCGTILYTGRSSVYALSIHPGPVPSGWNDSQRFGCDWKLMTLTMVSFYYRLTSLRKPPQHRVAHKWDKNGLVLTGRYDTQHCHPACDGREGFVWFNNRFPVSIFCTLCNPHTSAVSFSTTCWKPFPAPSSPWPIPNVVIGNKWNTETASNHSRLRHSWRDHICWIFFPCAQQHNPTVLALVEKHFAVFLRFFFRLPSPEAEVLLKSVTIRASTERYSSPKVCL